MKRTKEVRLGLLASTAAMMMGCGPQQPPHYDVHRQCVDQNQVVVADRYCEQQNGATSTFDSSPYRWYYYGGGYYYGHSTTYIPVPFGSRASGGSFSPPAVASSGTVRGVFGGTAEGHGFAGEGAGE